MRDMNFNKKLLTLFLMILVAQVAISQNSPLSIKEGDLLLLTKVGTSNQKVKIDGAYRTKGFRFTPEKKIELGTGEYIKVTNITTGIPEIKICGNDLIQTQSSTINNFIQARKAADKGANGFGAFLEKYTWYMIEDTLYIPTNYLLDNRHAFFLKTIPGNIMLPQIPYDYTTNELVLTKDYFVRNDIHLTPESIFQFRVEYWEGHHLSEVITDNFYIEYIPFFKEERL